MDSLTLTDRSGPLVADTSVVINLITTGCAPAIVRALPNRVVVVDVVRAELETAKRRGLQHLSRLSELVATGVIEIVRLDDAAMQYFEDVVIGPAALTLDDGEAATIAYAIEQDGTALIDERKATRICAARFPGLSVGCTVDILIHPGVQYDLGAKALGDAIFNALRDGRMRVFPDHLEWVIGLIGHERAALCQSLPRSLRLSPQTAP